MSAEKPNNQSGPENQKQPSVNTGNASNPSPHEDNLASSEGSQLLDKKAEKYLREVASIEDIPDAQDQQELDESLAEENDQ